MAEGFYTSRNTNTPSTSQPSCNNNDVASHTALKSCGSLLWRSCRTNCATNSWPPESAAQHNKASRHRRLGINQEERRNRQGCRFAEGNAAFFKPLKRRSHFDQLARRKKVAAVRGCARPVPSTRQIRDLPRTTAITPIADAEPSKRNGKLEIGRYRLAHLNADDSATGRTIGSP
jgi:hypothetical protein